MAHVGEELGLQAAFLSDSGGLRGESDVVPMLALNDPVPVAGEPEKKRIEHRQHEDERDELCADRAAHVRKVGGEVTVHFGDALDRPACSENRQVARQQVTIRDLVLESAELIAMIECADDPARSRGEETLIVALVRSDLRGFGRKRGAAGKIVNLYLDDREAPEEFERIAPKRRGAWMGADGRRIHPGGIGDEIPVARPQRVRICLGDRGRVPLGHPLEIGNRMVANAEKQERSRQKDDRARPEGETTGHSVKIGIFDHCYAPTYYPPLYLPGTLAPAVS